MACGSRPINLPDHVARIAPVQGFDRSPAHFGRGLKTASAASPFDADGPSICPSICTAAICCRSPPRTNIAQIIGTARGSVTSVSPCSAFARLAASLLSSPSRSFSSFVFQCLSACFWCSGLLLRRRDLLGFDPAVALLLVAQMFPGGLARRVEPGHRTVVRHRLLLEPFFFAPRRQLHLGLGLVGRACAAVEVFSDDRLVGRVVLDLLADDVGPVPFSLIRDQPISPRASVLAGSYSTASERCLSRSVVRPCASHQRASRTWRIGIAAGLAPGRLVVREIGRRCGLESCSSPAPVRPEQSTAHQDHADHDYAPRRMIGFISTPEPAIPARAGDQTARGPAARS